MLNFGSVFGGVSVGQEQQQKRMYFFVLRDNMLVHSQVHCLRYNNFEYQKPSSFSSGIFFHSSPEKNQTGKPSQV